MEQSKCDNCGASDFWFTYSQMECKYCRSTYPREIVVPATNPWTKGHYGYPINSCVTYSYPCISTAYYPEMMFPRELE